MGFKVKKTVLELTFEDPEYAELQISVRALSVRGLFTFDALEAAVQAIDPNNTDDGEKALHDQYDFFCSNVISWNAEDEETGEPLPCTVDTLFSQEPAFVRGILRAWRRAVVGIPAPLPQPSSNGDPSLELSEMMEPPSQSLAS